MQVSYSNELPPNWEELQKHFIVDWDVTVVTYGDKIHSQFRLPQDVIVHELVHVKQQLKMGVEEWWDKYLNDPKFRLNQEALAYREQYKFAKDKAVKPQVFLADLAKTLSGPMYDNMVSFKKALKLIKG